MYDDVIFDWHGTLAKTKDVVVYSFQQVLKEKKIDVTQEFITERLGTSAREVLREILKSSGCEYNEALLNELVQKRIDAEIEKSSEVKLNDGALDLLEALKGKVKLGLASMNNRQVVDHSIESCGLKGYFEVINSIDEVENPKPHPEIFQKTASKLLVSPKKCVVFEDSIYGIRAAKSAGMACIAVITDSFSKDQITKENPDLIISSLTQKKKILDFLYQSDSHWDY